MEREGIVFEIKITKYNYTQGYIPINKEMQNYFPKVSIKNGFTIYLNEKDIISNCTYTYSNRKYINCGDELKKWYSENFRIDDKIQVCLMDENKIELSLIKISEHNAQPKIDLDKNRNIKKQLNMNNEPNYNSVKHMALVKDWESKNNDVDGPITLVLGSFNPYFPKSETDFYYGRIAKGGRGNQFWKSIGRSIHPDNEDYFQTNTQRKLAAMKEFKFIFMDIIDEINFTYPDEQDSSIIFNEYKTNKIIGNFGDQDIFTSDTTYKSKDSDLKLKIKLQRNYNNRIIEKIQNLKSLKFIVNTMGDNDYGRFEKNKTELSFQNFKKSLLKAISERDEIHFDLESQSPSGFAVRTEQDKNEFDVWMRNKVLRI